MRRIITATILFLLTFQAFGQNYKYVNTKTLNVRENAGKRYNIVGKVNRGDKITALTERGRWTEIETENGTKGYVSTKYLIDNQETDKGDKGLNWQKILLIGIILYALFKIFLKSSGSHRRSTPKLKEIIIKWYHCKNCNEKIKASQRPTNNSCSGSSFHFWTDLGKFGDHAYNCKNCGTTVYTMVKPTNNNCSNGSFHFWTKLS